MTETLFGPRKFNKVSAKAKKTACLIMCLILLLLTVLPAFAAGADGRILVGYYSEPGMMYGAEDGAAKSGYAYEFMQEVAAHTGWRYEYVYGSFSELTDKLAEGKIDILPLVSASNERKSQLLFPDYKMADELFYIASRKRISLSDDYRELAGKTIASVDGYYQNVVLDEFLKENNLDCKVVLYKSADEKWNAVNEGRVDFSVESSLTIQPVELYAVCEIGSMQPVYTAVSPKRPDLLNEFNGALKEIEEEKPGFFSELQIKYYKSVPLFKSMSKKDMRWLEEHKKLTIGVFTNDEPLVIKNDDGKVTGIMPDYIRKMFADYGIEIELDWVFYDSIDSALEGLRGGEVDVTHPFYSSYSAAESEGVIISSTVYKSTMNILYIGKFNQNTMKRIATPVTRLGGNYVRDNYPNSEIVPCLNGYDCINKLMSGEADCVVMNTSALRKISNSYNELFTGKTLNTLCNTCFAALPENSAVIDIINRAIPFLSDADLNEIEAEYFVETDADITLIKFFKQNPGYLIAGVIFLMAIASGFITLIVKRRAEKAQRDELEVARNAAESASKAKTSFLFNMSHDIRTPMNAILGYTDVALRHEGDAEKVDDSLKKIKISGEHLLDLINDILEMSRIEAGRLELTSEPLDIRMAIRSTENMSSVLATPKSIHFNVSIGEIRNPYVFGDELHVNEVVINIISNAMKYTKEDGHVSYTVWQQGEAENETAWFVFEVKDDGIGMSEEFLEHIYETFAREKTSTVSKLEGVGLGLSIVKRIVDLAQGTIDIKSKPNVGTTVTVKLPFRVMSEADIEAFKQEQTEAEDVFEEVSLEGRRVLVVEDNEMNREIAEEILTEAGLVVESAEDGDIAVKMVSEKGTGYYDCILMDIQMPVMNGHDATRAIRKLPDGDKIPIIALSANAFEEDKQKSKEAGMNDHVAKPIDVKVLFDILKKMI